METGYETVTVSAGVHIFNRSQSKATDNYYIYIDISQDQDFTNLLRELRFNSGFTDRCTQLGITNFQIEVTINEKRDRKLVVLNQQFIMETRCETFIKGRG